MADLQNILHLVEAGLSAYSLFHAYTSITNLRKWEDTTKQAAQYSETAAQELHKTRTTQTSGTLALLFSLSSALLAVARPFESSSNRAALNAINAVVCILARAHVSGFWTQKTKVPLVQSYNDAINSTLITKRQLGILAIAWLVTTGFEARAILG